MSGIRGDSGHTSAGHVVLLSNWPWGEWWERLLRRAARRGGQDGHSEDIRRLRLSRNDVNENKCSVGRFAAATRIYEHRNTRTTTHRAFVYVDAPGLVLSSNSRRNVNGPNRWVTRMPQRRTVIVPSFFHETL